MDNTLFTKNDIEQIKERGISDETIRWQLKVFNEGVPFMQLNRAATIGDGIKQYSEKQRRALVEYYDNSTHVSKVKFVPASGAASRMFKDLFAYLETEDEASALKGDFMSKFTSQLKAFAFYPELKAVLKAQEKSIDTLIESGNYKEIVEALLLTPGLKYGSLPKGLLSFHTYDAGSRKAFEEHLVEGARYAQSGGNVVNLHFTVSPEHQEEFIALLAEVKRQYEDIYGVTYKVSFSVQQPATDTMAVDMDNKPFRETDSSILFRPGGHGALINNLNALSADLVFIKNIDNVVPEKLVEPTVEYKKVLAGTLLESQKQVFDILNELDSDTPTTKRLEDIYSFIKQSLHYELQQIPDFDNRAEAVKVLKTVLNRPIRVCGVVKNQGEPGGGPYWAPNSMGDITLQIIESSQVDQDDEEQVKLFKGATHFNPVDLVCGIKDYKGNKFNLEKFVDQKTCFISKKSKNGKDLKALELPGLWNGAMADWLTIFVEVPLETFNPVKTVNDLLRPQHQA